MKGMQAVFRHVGAYDALEWMRFLSTPIADSGSIYPDGEIIAPC